MPRPRLHKVAAADDVAAAADLVRLGADIHAIDGSGNTALHEAAAAGSKRVTQELIISGAVVDAAGSVGRTPLFLAAIKGQTEVVQLLLQARASPSVADMQGKTALQWATEDGHSVAHGMIVQLLRDAPALAPVAEGVPEPLRWEWWGGGRWQQYGKTESVDLESAFQRKQGPVSMGIRVVEVNLSQPMVQKNVSTSKVRPVRRSATASRADPHWIPDAAYTHCMQCGDAKFSKSVPRHHCRYCGWVVCKQCWTKELAVDQWVSSQGDHDFQHVTPPAKVTKKVCDSCFEHAPKEVEARATVELTTLPTSEVQGVGQSIAMVLGSPSPVRRKTMTLYHCTDDAGALAIATSGFMLRGSLQCMFGSGIYFAESADIARNKAWFGRQQGCVVKAQVALGKQYAPPAANRDICYEMLQGNVPGRPGIVYHSVWGRSAPKGPLREYDEWVVYSAYQVKILSITRSDGTLMDFKPVKAKPKPRSKLSRVMDFGL
jgi:hypothetical protein